MVTRQFSVIIGAMAYYLQLLCFLATVPDGIPATTFISLSVEIGQSAHLRVPYSDVNPKCDLIAAVWSRRDSEHILFSVTKANDTTYGEDIGTVRGRVDSEITPDEVVFTIRNVTCADEWRYECKVYCTHRTTLEYEVNLTVKENPGQPYIEWQLRNESGQVDIYCAADVVWPAKQIEWESRYRGTVTRDKSPGCPPREVSIFTTTLYAEEDGTEFFCRVGERKVSMVFETAQKPRISIVSVHGNVSGNIPSGKLRLGEGAEVTLTCTSEGNPPPIYKWKFSPTSSASHQEKFIQLSWNTTAIVVRHSKESEDGFYICEALNSFTQVADVKRASLLINMTRMTGRTMALRDSSSMSLKERIREIAVSSAVGFLVLIAILAILVAVLCHCKKTRARQVGTRNLLLNVVEYRNGQESIPDANTFSYMLPVSRSDECEVLRKPKPAAPHKHSTVGHINNSLYVLSSNSRVELLNELGNGFYGTVYKALMKIPQGGVQVVAAKLCTGGIGLQDMELEFMREAETMQMVPKHPNVVDYIGYVQRDNGCGPSMILLEYASNGDLLTILRSMRHNTLQPHDMLSFALQVAQGMEHISKFNLLHRDLAARNVLVFPGKTCKISDFGQARYMARSRGEYERRSAGPLPIRWMAPESITNNTYTTKSDVWAFGILMWEIVTLGAVPYSGYGGEEVVTLVTEGRSEALLDFPADCNPAIARLARECWTRVPRDRPDFSSLAASLSALNVGGNTYIHMQPAKPQTRNEYENYTSETRIKC
ncbi:ephrin type-B receptor 3 [Lingula anatina]|uniref:receptor protein-tyrosine kinase n=1 Tax=Lingula anatina TaxID=7574 RepID=A0A1S3HEM7_LINAN|nr:ephrin type-B receptor 3 [Lingula anatina]|eukprot:XP_013384532.1 ephrin type-B receptor 3 [Lingula anatina]